MLKKRLLTFDRARTHMNESGSFVGWIEYAECGVLSAECGVRSAECEEYGK